jgi:hypothetical protein
MREIETIPHIDEALDAIRSGLKRNPYEFPITPPITSIRVAATDFYQRDDFSVPALILYFTIIEDDKIVRIIDVLNRGFGYLEDF